MPRESGEEAAGVLRGSSVSSLLQVKSGKLTGVPRTWLPESTPRQGLRTKVLSLLGLAVAPLLESRRSTGL